MNMAEASKNRVTVTLGRSGQVVKRGVPVLDVPFADSLPTAGSKRPLRERLGTNVDGSLLHGRQLDNKRQRGYDNISNLRTNGNDDICISKDDLRFKIMQKNMSRQTQMDDGRRMVDLREKLSRVSEPSSLRSSDARQRVSVCKEASILGRIPFTRSANALPQIQSSRGHSAWTLDSLRRRSPDGILASSRGRSPQGNMEELQRRSSNMTYDDVRSAPYMSKDSLNISRPMNTASFMSKPTLSTGFAKPVAPVLSHLPPPSGILHKTSYMGEEQQTIESLLHSLGLEKYAILLKAEEVDMAALKQMGENDLKELGIPMGPRKKILLALMHRSKGQPLQSNF